MNTKKYLALFADMTDKGELPRDVYDLMMSEIAREGKMTKRIYALYLDELEKRALFDVDGAPFDTANSAETDGTYVYKRPKNPLWHIAHAVWGTAFKLIGYFGAGIVFGVWRVGERKNLKGVRACITTSNHVGYLDSVLTRRALGGRKQYIAVAPHNCKYTVGGAILRSAIVLPLPQTLKGARVFNDMLSYVTERGAAIHFYAEKSMWIGYKKPRPFKDGAFIYADKLDIPVVPMFYCFKKPRGLRRLLHLPKAVIKIGGPIYADKSLPQHERTADIRRRAEKATAELYRQFYGDAPHYLCDAPAQQTEQAE